MYITGRFTQQLVAWALATTIGVKVRIFGNRLSSLTQAERHGRAELPGDRVVPIKRGDICQR